MDGSILTTDAKGISNPPDVSSVLSDTLSKQLNLDCKFLSQQLTDSSNSHNVNIVSAVSPPTGSDALADNILLKENSLIEACKNGDLSVVQRSGRRQGGY